MDKHVLPKAGSDVEQQPPEVPVVVVDVPSPPPVDTKLQSEPVVPIDVPTPPLVDTELQPEPVVPIDVPPRPRHNLELPMLVLAFCLTAAIDIAIQSVQNRKEYPLNFHLVCLMMVFALASIVVAKYVHQNYPNGARVLKNVGVLFGITSFFFAISMSFPIWFTIISWLIYALSLLAILACNYPKSLFS